MEIFSHRIRALVIGINKEKTAIGILDIPHAQVSGGGHHLTVIVVGKILIDIFIKKVKGTPLQKSCLIGLAIFFAVLAVIFIPTVRRFKKRRAARKLKKATQEAPKADSEE